MKKRSLLFVSLSSYDTLQNSIHSDILEFLSKRFSVYVFCYGERFMETSVSRCRIENSASELVSSGVRYYSGGFLDWFRYIFEIVICKSFRRFSYVYINDFFVGGLFGTIVSVLFGSKLVFRCGSLWKYPMKSALDYVKSFVVFFSKPLVLSFCDRVVYNSKSIVSRVFSYKSSVVYNFVDRKLFFPVEKNFKNKKIGKGQGKKSRKLSVLFIGRVRYEKGISYLCEAVRRSDSKIKLTVVGAGELVGSLKARYSDVSFIGRVERGMLREEILSSDVVVLPSLWESSESFPNVLVEAMACGRFVIGTRVFGIPELIDDGVNGLLVKPKSVLALREALSWCLENREKLRKMGSMGLEKVNQCYDKEKQLDKLYNRLF